MSRPGNWHSASCISALLFAVRNKSQPSVQPHHLPSVYTAHDPSSVVPCRCELSPASLQQSNSKLGHLTAVSNTHTHIHTCLTALFPGLPGWACTRKVKPIWILVKQETVSGRGISWTICKSAPRSRQITMPAPHHSVFYRPDALPAAQPTASKHWRPVSTKKERLIWARSVGVMNPLWFYLSGTGLARLSWKRDL